MEKFSTSIKSHKLESRCIEFFISGISFYLSEILTVHTRRLIPVVLLALKRLDIILCLDLHVSKTYIMRKIHIIPDNY